MGNHKIGRGRGSCPEPREDRYSRSIGLRVIRYINDDILKNVAGVLEDLAERLSSGSTSPHPSLRRRGEDTES